jgi:protein associated with RNAse G/E
MAIERYTLTSYKYPWTPHRRWPAYGPVQGEEECLLFARPRDVWMEYVGQEKGIFFAEPSWDFVWPARGYKLALWFEADGSFGGLYGDICMAPKVNRLTRRVDFLDLDLDVVVRGDGGSPEVVDRDEFEERRQGYPASLAAFAEGALERLLGDIRAGAYPLDRPLDVWRQMLTATVARIAAGEFEGGGEA